MKLGKTSSQSPVHRPRLNLGWEISSSGHSVVFIRLTYDDLRLDPVGCVANPLCRKGESYQGLPSIVSFVLFFPSSASPTPQFFPSNPSIIGS
ncbi:hypothetical protein PR048_025732 [Dryococelus australis]|uniref:Uncharacterized protein n=1 Tax=Dryococelus australis TaxID=614101 RepID=A0ABQ9GJB9_9NEOP|nr:hypothetical protein PR048_025732 [Dryococelus australis]